MALLAFDIPKLSSPAAAASAPSNGTTSSSKKNATLEAPPSLVELLTPAQRLKTAGELNAAILTSQSQGKEPKLPQLVRLLVYGEGLLSEEKMNFPRLDLAGSLELGKAPAAMTATTMTTTRDDEAF